MDRTNTKEGGEKLDVDRTNIEKGGVDWKEEGLSIHKAELTWQGAEQFCKDKTNFIGT